MDIIIFEAEEWERESFGTLPADHDLHLISEALTPDNAGSFMHAEIISTFIYSDLSMATLAKFNKLRLIATRSTGFDHIDLGYCDKHGIKVANVPDYGVTPVAEHVFALLLALSHRLIEAADRTRRGDFSGRDLRGFDLEDKTIGVIGAGAIGQGVLRIAAGFGMKRIAFDPRPDHSTAKRLKFEYVDFESLLQQADIITLHVPANAATIKMLAREQFDMMKKGVVIINTARGALIDVVELVAALYSKKVAGAGLDVLSAESTIHEGSKLARSLFGEKSDLAPLLADQIMLRLPNVVVTPHNAFNTREAMSEIINTTSGNIAGYLRGEPKNLIN
ncbi:MAG: NAD(P)-dependent oxidoreductase [Desulfurivibrionaceae bacterium]